MAKCSPPPKKRYSILQYTNCRIYLCIDCSIPNCMHGTTRKICNHLQFSISQLSCQALLIIGWLELRRLLAVDDSMYGATQCHTLVLSNTLEKMVKKLPFLHHSKPATHFYTANYCWWALRNSLWTSRLAKGFNESAREKPRKMSLFEHFWRAFYLLSSAIKKDYHVFHFSES